jgi:DNA polymerase I
MSKVKEHFTSRFGDNGCLIECDWSQFECAGWGQLTKDTKLLYFLNNGIDIHRMIGAMVHDCKPEEVTDEQRKLIKPATFLFIYGGSSWEYARVHEVSQEFADRLYDTFWSLFPEAAQWQNNLVRMVEATKYRIDESTILGEQRQEGFLKSVTGRKYFFKTYDESEYQRRKGKLTKFKKSEIVNYPVQGFCTADIHLIFLGILFRQVLPHKDKCLLVNTVHDSTIIDCKKEFVGFTCNLVKHSVHLTKERLKEKFDINLVVPLDMEFKVGNSWGNMVKI